jgi:hypothetical protein
MTDSMNVKIGIRFEKPGFQGKGVGVRQVYLLPNRAERLLSLACATLQEPLCAERS